jgi:hypothetical protein
MRGNTYTEDQVGENIVFDVVGRYTGVPLSQDEDLLSNTALACYRVARNVRPMVDLSLSGKWVGEFVYGEAYGKSLIGKKEGFTFEITVTAGEVQGTCVDHNKLGDAPATLAGFFYMPFLCFLKEYAVPYVIQDNGEIMKDTSRPPLRIAYSGLLEAENGRFKGVWKIEGGKGGGEWNMWKDDR